MKLFPSVDLPSSSARLAALSLALAFTSNMAIAQTITKADNTTALGTGASWTGGTAPGSGNIANWSGAYATAGSLSAALPGSALSWQGLSIGNITGTAAGLVSIGGTGNAVASSSLTLGTSGIDMSGSNQNLVINAVTIVFTGNQGWNIGTGRNLRLGTTGTGAGNANVDGTATINITGGGVVDANQGGGTGFTDAAGFGGFSGKWVVNSGATLRGIRNGATAWGTSSAADAITLSGGTLAVGGISGTQGDWTWNTPITLTAGTSSIIDHQNFSGTDRYLKLNGAITSGDANTVLTFNETASFSNADKGFVVTANNSSLSGTVNIGTVGGTNTVNVRVGGIGGTDTTMTAGTTGTLGNAAVVINNGVLTLSRSDTWTFGNSISGAGSLRIGGGVSSAGTQVVTISGDNSFVGGTTVGASGSTLKLGHANALGTGTLTIGTGTILDNVSGSALSIANAFTLSGGSPTFTGTDDMTIGGAVTISGLAAGSNRTLTVSAKTLTLSGAISESGGTGQGLTKAGPGTLTLSNANSSFTGQVTLTGGITNVAKLAPTGSNSSLGAGNAAYTIRFNGGTMNYNGAGGDTTDRTIQMQASGVINNNSTTGTIAFTAANISHSGSASARTLTLGGTYTGGANTFGSNITDSGTGANITSLVKNGGSTWTLSGANNTYTGTTAVNDGTLLINGTHTGTGLITSSSGATLGGVGTMVNVEIANGGVLAPGSSAGTITMASLVLNPSSTLEIELGDPANPLASDQVVVTNWLEDWGGVLNVSALPGIGTPAPYTSWLVIDYSTAPLGAQNNGSTLTLGTNTTGLNLALDASQAGKVLLVVVPEPASAGLLLLGFLLLRRLRRA